MSNQDEDLLLSHDEDQSTSTRAASSLLTPEATSKIASEMHRWGRMTGAFSIIVVVIWLVLDALPSAGPEVVAVRSSLLWPGVVLAVLAVIGLFGGFGLDYLAGREGLSQLVKDRTLSLPGPGDGPGPVFAAAIIDAAFWRAPPTSRSRP